MPNSVVGSGRRARHGHTLPEPHRGCGSTAAAAEEARATATQRRVIGANAF